MNSNNELTILKNSGLNKMEIAKQAILVAISLSFFCYCISLYFMPLANKSLRMARKNFQHNYANITISPGVFESLNNLTIYVNGRDENNKLSGILLYDNYNKDSSITLTAKSGDLVQENGAILMRLKNGTLQKYNFNQRNSEILNFDSYVVNLSQNKEENFGHVWTAQERYLHELLNPDDLDPDSHFYVKQSNSIRVEIHQRFTYPLFSLMLALIACSYILKGEFSRRGSSKNNIQAVGTACAFIGITMVSYDLMEKSRIYTALLYGNFFFFTSLSIYLLRNNYRK
jgi:lipopolysaccharide export system permease protein